ncbi:MAG: gamma-glutamyl-gamma-aminobutyrate hydrolase family protein [Faecalibacterium sp.]
MPVTIAMPQMGSEPQLTPAQSKYVESLERAGAAVRWICLDDPFQAVQESLSCDGLLLPGGGDMSPAFFGQQPLPACGKPNPVRDAAEPLLLQAFWSADRPILGICRGVQVLNICLGGNIHQDITPLERCSHNDHWDLAHNVIIRRNSLLWQAFGTPAVQVNSQHHQAVDRLAPGLTVTALSEDGFVEAVEAPGRRFCLGVQWHPEWLSAQLPAQQRIFNLFVSACRQ